MTKRKNEDEIDERVAAQADDDTAWTKPMTVKRNGVARINLPAKLAAKQEMWKDVHADETDKTCG